MYKIAVFGESESVMAFSALGLDVYTARQSEEPSALAKRFRALCTGGEYAIIYLTESFYEVLSDEVKRFKDSVTPAVILIPGANGSLGYGENALEEAIERAVGANIL